MDLILATSNEHKAEEFNILVQDTNLKIRPATRKLEVDENGATFSDNALLKARAYYDLFKRPVVADDSGLEVAALPGELGIYTARFGGESLTSRERAELLVQRMEGIENREAYFVCVLCLYLSPEEIYFFEGRLHGHIHSCYEGSGGFGYDPVFLPAKAPEVKTLADLSDWKQTFSHRAVATGHMVKFLQERHCQN